MKKRLFSTLLFIILLSLPVRIRAAECGLICGAWSMLPSTASLVSLGAWGTVTYVGAYWGGLDAREKQETTNDWHSRQIEMLQKKVVVHGKWNAYLAALLPNDVHPDGTEFDRVTEFGQSLTKEERELFLKHANDNAYRVALSRFPKK